MGCGRYVPGALAVATVVCLGVLGPICVLVSIRGSPSDRRLALAFALCGSTGGGAVGDQTTYGQDNMTKATDATRIRDRRPMGRYDA